MNYEIKQFDEIKEATEQIINFLRKNGDPYTQIVIDQTGASIMITPCRFVGKEPLD